MDWLFNPLHDTHVQRSLAACALIGFTNGFLGAFVVLRRLALMADSLSHSLMPGVALGLILFGLAPAGLFVGALCAALLVGIGAQLLARGSRIKEDTALGILYTMAFSAGLVMISFVKVRISLTDYLFGNIALIANADLWAAYGISLIVIPVLVALQRPLLLTLFDPTVAASQGVRVNALNLVLVVCLVLTLISSLQAVGVILLLGLLIAPAATIYLLSDSYPVMLWGGGLLGALGSCVGLLISHWFDLPSGACIVLLLGLVFCATWLLSPRYGLLPRMLRRRHFHGESLARWPGAEPSEESGHSHH
ncbi:MAG TPA: metal ABC transporter permease [Chthoniobacteraceae bacterium]|jgi:ABC-type Mn2+/Zn2+ transport system permease subunit|nr:metal ABC transporter permease [Chthoniobacteraceae bacterium]